MKGEKTSSGLLLLVVTTNNSDGKKKSCLLEKGSPIQKEKERNVHKRGDVRTYTKTRQVWKLQVELKAPRQ